ncbi:MAG: lysophospholipid acyltransferase family protein [Chthoniobacterales bacterium]
MKDGLPPRDPARPVVIFLNHASWWDPLACLILARQLFPERTSFAPIEDSMLQRYKFFRHLGFFGVEPSVRGALKFLRVSRAILSSPSNVIWLTPQGRFSDVRERPLRLQNGLGALAAKAVDTIFLPLAFEYTFWNDSRPEILVSFGASIVTGSDPSGSAQEWTKKFSVALAATQDKLAAHSSQRDASEWITMNEGSSGVSAVYDFWRWLRARIRGQEFEREHPAEVTR